jgi:hypothetical protein
LASFLPATLASATVRAAIRALSVVALLGVPRPTPGGAMKIASLPLRAPGKLVRSSRWKSGPSKGQRPLGSECCVATGDSGCEAYTAIAWGVGLSREIATLRDKIAVRRDAYEREYERTSQIIESRFDEEVRRVFRRLREEVPKGLLQLDSDISHLVDGYLRSRNIPYTRTRTGGRVFFEVAGDAALPVEIGEMRRFATGDARGLVDAQALNLLHPLVRAAIEDARTWPGGSVELMLPADAGQDLAALAGQTGVLAVAVVDYAGFEPVQ